MLFEFLKGNNLIVGLNFLNNVFNYFIKIEYDGTNLLDGNIKKMELLFKKKLKKF